MKIESHPENFSGRIRKVALSASAATGIMLSSAGCIRFGVNDTPPSKDTGNYEWVITANDAKLYTNTEPEIVDGVLKAKDVFCPKGNEKFIDKQSMRRSDAGCDSEFMPVWIAKGDYRLATNDKNSH